MKTTPKGSSDVTWAKSRKNVGVNLARSGMPPLPLSELAPPPAYVLSARGCYLTTAILRTWTASTAWKRTK